MENYVRGVINIDNGIFAGGGTSSNRQACEVYSRVVGYIRPVSQWNPGKQSEFVDRKYFLNHLEKK